MSPLGKRVVALIASLALGLGGVGKWKGLEATSLVYCLALQFLRITTASLNLCLQESFGCSP